MPTLREMADAYVLSGVLSYSAIHAIYPRSRIILSVLASIVLLLNSHYLHAPIHIPSTLFALLVLLIPFSPSHFSELSRYVASAIPYVPHLALELLIGFMLIAWLIRTAFVKPWKQAVEQRRQVVPIQPAQQQPRIISEDQVRDNARAVLTAQNEPEDEQQDQLDEQDEIQPEIPRVVSEQQVMQSARETLGTLTSAQQQEAIRLARQMHLDAKRNEHASSSASKKSSSDKKEADEGENKSQSALTPKETFSKPQPVRRKRVTKSHELAAKIFAEKEEEKAREEAARRAMQEAYEAERMAKEEFIRKREELKERLKEAEEEEKEARRELMEINAQADRAREWRRRSLDQARLGNFEGEVEEARQRVVDAERRESQGLKRVTEARGKLVQLREELQRSQW